MGPYFVVTSTETCLLALFVHWTNRKMMLFELITKKKHLKHHMQLCKHLRSYIILWS